MALNMAYVMAATHRKSVSTTPPSVGCGFAAVPFICVELGLASAKPVKRFCFTLTLFSEKTRAD
jgi:hypothetical protein